MLVSSLCMYTFIHLVSHLVRAVLSKEDKTAMACLMCHSSDTQKGIYDKSLKTLKRLRISVLLNKLL